MLEILSVRIRFHHFEIFFRKKFFKVHYCSTFNNFPNQRRRSGLKMGELEINTEEIIDCNFNGILMSSHKKILNLEPRKDNLEHFRQVFLSSFSAHRAHLQEPVKVNSDSLVY